MEMKLFKRTMAVLLSAAMIITAMSSGAFAASTTYTSDNYKAALTKTEAYTAAKLAKSAAGGEWLVLGLSRDDADIDNSLYDDYKYALLQEVKADAGVLSQRNYTVYAKTVLTWGALGGNPAKIGGYNFFKKLADMDALKNTGLMGPTWALIALEYKNYQIPAVTGITNVTTREKLVDYLLNAEIKTGGFALSGNTPDCDVTAMVLQALAPFSYTRSDVKACVDRGLKVLSDMQNSDGSFSSGGVTNSESAAQVIVVLTTLGIDPTTDSRFIKNGVDPVDSLLSFFDPSTGGFRHVNAAADGYQAVVNGMATEQAQYALVAYKRFKAGRSSLYDITDVKTAAQIKVPAKTAITYIASPKKGTLVLKWKKVAGATGYEIIRSKNLTHSDTITVKVRTSLSKTLKNLPKGNYYIKIRTYKICGAIKVYGGDTAVKRIKIS